MMSLSYKWAALINPDTSIESRWALKYVQISHYLKFFGFKQSEFKNDRDKDGGCWWKVLRLSQKVSETPDCEIFRRKLIIRVMCKDFWNMIGHIILSRKMTDINGYLTALWDFSSSGDSTALWKFMQKIDLDFFFLFFSLVSGGRHRFALSAWGWQKTIFL